MNFKIHINFHNIIIRFFKRNKFLNEKNFNIKFSWIFLKLIKMFKNVNGSHILGAIKKLILLILKNL